MVTGASGGSILAALLAIKTEEELLNDVLTEDFSTDFKVCVYMYLLRTRKTAGVADFALTFTRAHTHTHARDHRAAGR